MERGKGKMKETQNRGRRAKKGRQGRKDNLSSNFHSPSSVWVGCEPWEFDGEKWVPQSATERRQIRSYRDLDVFNLAYTLALWNTVPGILTSPMEYGAKETRYAAYDIPQGWLWKCFV